MAELIPHDKLLFAPSIELPNFGKVYLPKIRIFIESDFEYARFKRVFSQRVASLIDETHELYDKLKDFDLIVGYPELVEDLVKSLKILYKTDNIQIISRPKEQIIYGIEIATNDKTYYIHRDNYTEFADMILIILHEGNNIAEEKTKKELSEIELKMERKRREFERKKALREAESKKDEKPITIFDLANYIVNTDGSTFDYQSVLDLTVYQLVNTFNLYRQKEGYDINMACRTSGNFKIEDDVVHWFFDSNK